MRRQFSCRPGINDVRCKVQSKPSQFDDIIQDVNVTQQSRLSKVLSQAQSQPKSETKKVLGLVIPAKIAKATQKSLSQEQINKAKLVKASSIFYEEGTQKAQKYLNDNKLDYTIDWQLSNDSGLVLIDNISGKAVVAFRGTDIKSPSDLLTALDIIRNEEGSNQTFKDAKAQMEEVIQEYGAPAELLGFSRGGTIAMSLGNEFNVNTTTFNPFVNKSLATTLMSDAEHTIIRTTTDPISIGANLPNPNFKTIQINPKADSLNPLTNHELSQFLDNDTPRRTSPQELLQKFAETTGKVQSELITLKDMSIAINEGKSFSEFLSDFSPVDIADGQLSSRIFEDSNFTSWWKDSGGEFNPIEQSHLLSTPKGQVSEAGTTQQHREEFSKLPVADQDAKIAEIGDIHIKAIQKFSDFSTGEAQVQEVFDNQKISPNLSEEASTALAEQLSGASIGSGLIGSYVGNKVVQELDPEQKLKAQGDEVVSGFIAGGVGAALAGGTLLPAAIVGSVGMLAGSETTRALERAGVAKEGASTVGGLTGGATAGLAAATIGFGAAVAGGAEIGAAFAPETFGISIAVGAVIGGIAGLASSLWDDVFGDEDPAPPQKDLEPYIDTFAKSAPIRSTSSYQGTGYAPKAPEIQQVGQQPVQVQDTFASRPLPPQRPREMTSSTGRSTAPQIKPVIQINAEPYKDVSAQA